MKSCELCRKPSVATIFLDSSSDEFDFCGECWVNIIAPVRKQLREAIERARDEFPNNSIERLEVHTHLKTPKE